MTHFSRLADAFGQALKAHATNRDVCYVIERDDGYLDLDRTHLYFQTCRCWSPRERQGLRYARGRVLDIGCGAGRVALYLQAKGMDVLGIDPSPAAIEVCRARGLRQCRVMALEDLTPGVGRFDTILLLGNNFGLMGGPVSGAAHLRRLHEFTSESACIIAGSTEPLATSDPLHLAYHRRNWRRGRRPGQLRIRCRYRSFATPWFDYWLAGRREVIEVCAGSGWRVHEFIAGRSSSYIAIIMKDRSAPGTGR